MVDLHAPVWQTLTSAGNDADKWLRCLMNGEGDLYETIEILAEDLYELQFPEGKNRVSLRWGQDFYGGRNITEKQHEKEGAL